VASTQGKYSTVLNILAELAPEAGVKTLIQTADAIMATFSRKRPAPTKRAVKGTRDVGAGPLVDND